MNLEDYKQQEVTEEATFRAVPVAWTIDEAKSGAVAIHFIFSIRQRWHGAESGWSQEWAPGYYTENRTWVIGKAVPADPRTGAAAKEPAPNQGAIANLGKCGLWNGDFDALNGPPPQVVVHVDVKVEEFPAGSGRMRYRADWINADADVPQQGPGGFAPADASMLTSYRQRFGGATRAIAAGATGAGQAPAPPSTTGAPVPPPVTAPPVTAPPATQPQATPPPLPPPADAPIVQPVATPPQAPPAGPPAGDGLPMGGDPTFIPVEAGGDPDDPIDMSDVPF